MKLSSRSATTLKSTTTETELFVQSPEKWTPHKGQRLGMKFLLEHAAGGLFADPGVGKTSTVFGAFKFLKKRGMAEKMLVIAPLRPCYLVWPKEQQKWLDFHDIKVVVLHGPKKDELLEEKADIYVINPEGLDWLIGATKTKSLRGKVSVTADMKWFKGLGFDTLVIDELSKFKNPQSSRHKAIKAIHGTFARRWGLTGTPAANGLMDLFGECYMLDMGRTFGPYITHFRNKYFVPGYDGFSWNLRRGAEQEIYERLAPLVLRLSAEDYVEMPQEVPNPIKFDLPAAAQKIYNELEDDMFTVLEGRGVAAANGGVASMKCRQVTNGGIYVEDAPSLIKKKGPREWVDIHDAKTDLLEDLIGEIHGAPLLVGYEFRHDLERLWRRFGKDIPYIGSGVSPKVADRIEQQWNRGEIPLLFGQPQSMGHGLNFQGAGNHVAWYGLTYDFDTYDQFNRRVRRQGNKNKRVFIHHFIARNTVDEVMYFVLRSKDHTQRHLLDALNVLKRRRRQK